MSNCPVVFWVTFMELFCVTYSFLLLYTNKSKGRRFSMNRDHWSADNQAQSVIFIQIFLSHFAGGSSYRHGRWHLDHRGQILPWKSDEEYFIHVCSLYIDSRGCHYYYHIIFGMYGLLISKFYYVLVDVLDIWSRHPSIYHRSGAN